MSTTVKEIREKKFGAEGDLDGVTRAHRDQTDTHTIL